MPRPASGTLGARPHHGGAHSHFPPEIMPAQASPEVSQGQDPIRDSLLSVVNQTTGDFPLTVNSAAGVRVYSGRNVSMNLPLPEQFDPKKDSWHTWKKSLVYFFRTIRLPDIRTEWGSDIYSLDIHSNGITRAVQNRRIPEILRS
jgi:hypothetical protein